MNIFVTNEIAEVAARELCDKHLIKMITESCQILANTVSDGDLFLRAPRKEDGGPRSKSHENNPCSKWVCGCVVNKSWLIDYTLEALREYRRRYKKNNTFTMVLPFVKWIRSKGYVDEAKPDEFAEVIPKSAVCRLHPNFPVSCTTDKYKLFIACDKIFAYWMFNKAPIWYRDLVDTPEVKYLRREAMKLVI